MSDNFDSLPVDDLLQQLKDTPQSFVVKKQDDPTTLVPMVTTEPPKEEELGEYIIKKTTTLVDQTMSAFKDIKDLAVATNDPDTISALAELVKSVGSSMDLLNKIHIQNKKTKTAKEIAEINAEAKRKQLEPPSTTTNILAIGTREEVLKMLAEASKKTKDVTDIEVVESTPSASATQIQQKQA